MEWSNEDVERLGGVGNHLLDGHVIRYVAGCIKRERQRVCRILEQHGYDSSATAAILSDVDDEKVFRWAGPTVKLEDPSKAPQEK